MSAVIKLSTACLDGASNEQLSRLHESERNMIRNANFHVDVQGLTSGDPVFVRIAMQVNNETMESSLQKLKGRTIGIAVVRVDRPIDPVDVRMQLLGSITGIALEKADTRNAIIAKGGDPFAKPGGKGGKGKK